MGNLPSNEMSDEEKREALENLKNHTNDRREYMLQKLESIDLIKMLKKDSRAGVTGLSNIGNTCFMNSGLQCLSNTEELTKYFLSKMYKNDINSNNPLGLGGKLAKAYASLLEDIWISKNSKTVPSDLKRVLGKRVARFSGYGQ